MDRLLEELQLGKHKSSKLSLKDVLRIGKEDVDRTSLKKFPAWSFLRKLIALDGTARNTRLDEFDEVTPGFILEDGMFEVFEMSSRTITHSIHPLDVLCALLHCSDSFLQQEIVTKMSMCQFAVPLLIPAGSNYTFMLWAMRDIIKRWRPTSLWSSKGFQEENITKISMPVFSFVRLGNCSLSKSKILNKILSHAQSYHDFFVHQDMECGYHPRTVSEGLLEMSWYFPGGSECSNNFHKPLAVINLRGDLNSNSKQFSLLTKVSSAVFIFTEEVQEESHNFLETYAQDGPIYFFIICPTKEQCFSEKMKKTLKKLSLSLNLKNNNYFIKDSSMNEAEIVKQIQMVMRKLTEGSPKLRSLEDLKDEAGMLDIQIDENAKECQKAAELAKKICARIRDVPQYKKEKLNLQGDLWKKITKNEKDLCRMTDQNSMDSEEYRSKLIDQNLKLRQQQSQQEFQVPMKIFIEALVQLSATEKLYFLKWMKFFLDNIAQSNLLQLQIEYMKYPMNTTEIIRIDQQMSDGSLGVEHFFREIGQMHESKFFSLSHTEFKEEFGNLPAMAAELLLQGLTMELIDGDTSSIPWQWITDVLNQVDIKTGGKCTMRVITVLGVQSTGKSTLLNTMFGLQFPVSCGRCTRGAFITLLNVQKDFQEELGCDFVLVIDTEGLKAPELASLKSSYEHDNELATLVVGLSDITIINMFMENTAEMKDILQIVVHAFLRMKEIGKKPNCQFVHQNVSDVSAYAMNMRHRKQLLDNLNEMTKAAAKMEKLDGITSFNDVMDYDLNEHTWYIPGLWYGVPPMAPISTEYSQDVFSLKKYLLQFMKMKLQKPQNIPAFLGWLKSLWMAVKHEKFIFSFRNSLVANAYDQLSVKYSELAWNFRKEMYNWMTESLNSIKNQREEDIVEDIMITLQKSMPEILKEEENIMQQSLNSYFENDMENANLVQRYLKDFLSSIKKLQREVQDELSSRCWEAVYIQKTKCKIQNLKDDCSSRIEAEVNSLLNSCKGEEGTIDEKEMEIRFEVMWEDTVKKFAIRHITKVDVDRQMLYLLRNEMNHKSGAINQQLLKIKQLSEFSEASFVEKDEHIDLQWYQKLTDTFTGKLLGMNRFCKDDCRYKMKMVAGSLLDQCTQYIDQKVNTKDNYHETFCHDLINMVNERIRHKDVKKLHTTDQFELDLKLLVLGRAVRQFQRMHNDFVQLNDPFFCLEAAKSEYFSIFKNVFQKKDECKARAKQFCQQCLKPAIVEYVNNHLGKEIVTDLLQGADNMKYMSRSFFQHRVQSKLIEDHKFDQYVGYINNYEGFVKKSILEFIKEKYGKHKNLEVLNSRIVSSIVHNVKRILQDPQVLGSKSVSDFLSKLCKILEKQLVISQDNIKLIIFQNSASVSQFVAEVESSLPEMELNLLTEMACTRIESVLAGLTLKPELQLFKKVIGCGKQCPFCKVPCEAGCEQHSEHFASIHRPQGLGKYRFIESNVLCSSLCSTDVVTETSFRNSDTDWKLHPYKEYQMIYPDWKIQPDPSISASDYWKFIFKEFNEEFAKEYNAKPAKLPKEWNGITKEQAIDSLKESYHMK